MLECDDHAAVVEVIFIERFISTPDGKIFRFGMAFSRDRIFFGTCPEPQPTGRQSAMPKSSLTPRIEDSAPAADTLTRYDEEHLVTYLRLLDADAEGADWAEVARIVLHIDPAQEPARARQAFESHLARAKWMATHGYQHLLRRGTTH